MDKEAVNATVTVIEWMKKNEPERGDGSSHHRVNAFW
jgi:hypothetical protein